MSKLKQTLFSLNDADRKIIEEALKEKDKEIEQLKQQLAEKQHTIDEINKEFVQAVHDWKTLCAEKDTRIADLEDKDWYEACIKQLEEQNDRLIDTIKEKDKEIKQLKDIIDTIDKFKQYNVDMTDYVLINPKTTIVDGISMANYIELKQNQTWLAIQKLEKVKELLLIESKNNPIIYDVNDDTVGGALDRDKTFEIIDQQIKELEGEKK